MAYATAYGKLGDLAEAAINDPELSAVFRSGNGTEIRAALKAHGFTSEDIEILGRGFEALFPGRPKEPPHGLTFWWW